MIRSLTDDEIKALHFDLRLRDIIATAEKLPPFPDVVWKVMTLVRNMAPVNEIEAALKYDQVIVARILALSQSSYYGRKSRRGSLRDAIMVLGDRKLIEVVVTACAVRYFRPDLWKCDSNEVALWRHSVATAIAGEMIARHLKHRKVLSIYTSSLLHDIGKTVLDVYTKGSHDFSNLTRITGHGLQMLAVEREALGIDHQELGAIIARRWQFPAEVIAGIAHHHSPEKATIEKDIAGVVYAADILSASIAPDTDSTWTFDPESDPVFRAFRVTVELMEQLRSELIVTLEEVTEFLTTS